jgi:hypothetical protein
MEQVHKEEAKEEEVVEGEDEENKLEYEEKEQQDIQVPPKTPRKQIHKNHPSAQIIGNKYARDETRRRIHSLEQLHLTLISSIDLRNFGETNKDELWIKYMDEELDQIENNDTWELVPRPRYKNVIDTKWIFVNNLNEYGHVTRNKARLV